MSLSKYQKYLKTFRRIPPAVVLNMGCRPYVMNVDSSCLCGTAIKADLEVAGKSKNDNMNPSDYQCKEKFGGSYNEWYDVYMGVVNPKELPIIERAFTHRILEVVSNQK